MVSRSANIGEIRYAVLLSISIIVILVSITVSNVAQEGSASTSPEGQVRCTNGNLVRSPTECPSTDVCPPPSGANTVAYCSHRESSSKNKQEIFSSKKKHFISVSTDEDDYKKGEKVRIIIKNTGSDPLVFSKTNTHIKIKNLKTEEIFPLKIHGMFVLDSGASKTLKWDQHDSNGDQVSAGIYRASLSSGSLDDRTTFHISG
jgi:hypothetical protein